MNLNYFLKLENISQMARNEEKAQAMLNRWIKMKRMLHSKEVEDRPSLADECNSITKCEKWRQ